MYTSVEELIKIQKSINTSTRLRVNKTLLNLHERRKLDSKRSKDEIKEITTSVKEIVALITSKFKEYGGHGIYDVEDIHSVGSMAEETGIGNPTEFDFIVELQKFSTANMSKALEIISIERDNDCATPFGAVQHLFQHAHIKVIDAALKTTFENYILNNEYLSKQLFSPNTRQAILNYALGNLQGTIISGSYGQLEVTDIPAGQNEPADSFVLLWKSVNKENFFITINIVMGIAVSQDMLKDRTSSVNCCLEILHYKPCFLLPAGSFQNNRCFTYAFSLTEVMRMKSLPHHHQICYSLMKDFVGQDGSISKTFTPYVLKTVILKHSEKCEEEKDIFACIVDIITKMSKTCLHGDFVHLAERTLFLKQNFISDTPCDKKVYHGFLDNLITLQILKVIFPEEDDINRLTCAFDALGSCMIL